MLKHLDLFSGIGGFALAARMVGGIKTIQFVEIDPYCQKVLAKNFLGVPIHDDITTFTAEPRQYDLVTGGFPCQDISIANPNGRGLEGKRSGLFHELMRIVRQCRPRYLVLENVSAMLSKSHGRVMGSVLWELSQVGYDAEWQTISAASMGAPHLRERVFVVAHPNGSGCKKLNATTIPTQSGHDTRCITPQWNPWGTEPGVLPVANGILNRVDQIRGCGNAIVPQVGAIALQRVLEIDSLTKQTN